MSFAAIYKSKIAGDLLLIKDSLLRLTDVCFEAGIADALKDHRYPLLDIKDPTFTDTVYWLDAYFAGDEPGRRPPMLQRGTRFRELVWDELIKIPYGQTSCYSDIAKAVAPKAGRERMSAQAVGGAVRHNSIPIFVPCHRVIGKDGTLTGFIGGLEVKAALLRLEGAKFKEPRDLKKA